MEKKRLRDFDAEYIEKNASVIDRQTNKPQNYDVDEEVSDNESHESEEARAKRLLEESRKRRALILSRSANSSSADNSKYSSDSKGALVTHTLPSNTIKMQNHISPPLMASLNDLSGVSKFSMFNDEDEESIIMETKSLIQRSRVTVTESGDGEYVSMDVEGHFKPLPGESLNHYKVLGIAGRGMFSTVVNVEIPSSLPDSHPCSKQSITSRYPWASGEELAVKVMRANDEISRNAQREIRFLTLFKEQDPLVRYHCIPLIDTCIYGQHTCLFFPKLHQDLKELLDKLGSNVGVTLSFIQSVMRQLVLGVSLLHRNNLLHTDIKPHNVLIDESGRNVFLSDFGSIVEVGEMKEFNIPSTYVGSRFYRAPEVILGIRASKAMDVWALGCVAAELYLGRVLFPGISNNDMLFLMQGLLGAIPQRLIKQHHAASQAMERPVEFDSEFRFAHLEQTLVGELKNEFVVKRVSFGEFKKDVFRAPFLAAKDVGDSTSVFNSFCDFLEKIFVYDPVRRITIEELISHPFILPS